MKKKIKTTEEQTQIKSLTKCSICTKILQGFGNNAEPVSAGRCCNTCNTIIVIPERIRQFFNQQ